MRVETFSTLTLTLMSITSGILILDLWYRQTKNILDDLDELEHNYQGGVLFLSFALLIWGVSGVIDITMNGHINQQIVKCLLSTINSLFILLSGSYSEYFPKTPRVQERYIRFSIVAVFALVFTAIIYTYQTYGIITELYKYDFIFSSLTALLIGYTLSKTFVKRKMYILAVYSLITLGLLLVAQPTIHFFIDTRSDLTLILGLYARLSFILVICFLAYSWTHVKYKLVFTQYQHAIKRYREAYNEVRVLEERVKTEREIASKSVRDTTWQEVSFKGAHKLGNPIDAIDTFLQSMFRRIANKDWKGVKTIASDIHEAVEDAKSVLAEFKSLTRLSQIKLRNCDIIHLIKKAVKSASEKGVNVEIINNVSQPQYAKNIDYKQSTIFLSQLEMSNEYKIVIDCEKIKHCFDELIANSMHWFDKEIRQIKIIIAEATNDIPQQLKQENRYIKVTYSDNGEGIPEDDKKKIFMPFYSTYQHGTGLGLSIINRIIELHDGLIVENGTLGMGATFEIYLPIIFEKK